MALPMQLEADRVPADTDVVCDNDISVDEWVTRCIESGECALEWHYLYVEARRMLGAWTSPRDPAHQVPHWLEG